MATFKTSVLLY